MMKPFLASATLAALSSPAVGQALNEDYPGRWHDDTPGYITRTLAANDVSGCGEYYYKPHRRFGGDFLVYCTANGASWAAYLVWPNRGQVNGPLPPDPGVTPPR